MELHNMCFAWWKKMLLLIWNLTNWCDYIFILTVLWRLLYLWYRKLQEKNLQHIAQICGKRDKVHWSPTVIQDQERKFQLKRLNRRNKYYFTARLIKLLLLKWNAVASNISTSWKRPMSNWTKQISCLTSESHCLKKISTLQLKFKGSTSELAISRDKHFFYFRCYSMLFLRVFPNSRYNSL